MRNRTPVILPLMVALATTAAGAQAESTDNDNFTRAWGLATLYKNTDNNVIQKIALSGRLQAEAYYFDADEGGDNDDLWRRSRFGFKAQLFHHWTLHIEGDFNLNTGIDDNYKRLTDAYIAWSPNNTIEIKALKQSAGFTLDGNTSSKKLLTLQRNNLTNNLWFTDEYFTGLSVNGTTADGSSYIVGAYSNDDHNEVSEFDASYFTLLSLSHDFSSALEVDRAVFRCDYVHNDKDPLAGTRDFSNVVSFSSQWENGPYGLWSDLAMGEGYGSQSNVWGLSLMPFYNINETFQAVARYTFINSSGDNGVRLGRYEKEIVSGRGDQYNELYTGLNLFFYGHKLKWQTGVQYAVMDDESNDGGEYDGWGITTGMRLSW